VDANVVKKNIQDAEDRIQDSVCAYYTVSG